MRKLASYLGMVACSVAGIVIAAYLTGDDWRVLQDGIVWVLIGTGVVASIVVDVWRHYRADRPPKPWGSPR